MPYAFVYVYVDVLRPERGTSAPTSGLNAALTGPTGDWGVGPGWACRVRVVWVGSWRFRCVYVLFVGYRWNLCLGCVYGLVVTPPAKDKNVS
ncbi:hypothetical protein P691DRAFT_806965 [Macrolepiota fuliginosa MF-IS2]|uniref:Uncharacterized protein n=1 Tax=Macrolepiota fuliginosa MF-IS2 TaxID=1400762 RepID=A0A9P5X571_9AGAR|nr:hypothetical protein P691DRAFT_806965 [Macrolepiota fuliginosa MF-IS2]